MVLKLPKSQKAFQSPFLWRLFLVCCLWCECFTPSSWAKLSPLLYFLQSVIGAIPPQGIFVQLAPKNILADFFRNTILSILKSLWCEDCFLSGGQWPLTQARLGWPGCQLHYWQKKKKKAYHSQTVPTISWLRLSCQIKFHAAGLSRRQKGSREGILCIIVMKRERGDEMGEEKHSHMKFQTMDTFII